MKKFLTVLLALSVVFTYSFSAVGSVFAATADPGSETPGLTYEQKLAEATRQLANDLENAKSDTVKKLANEYKEDLTGGKKVTIPKSVYETIANQVYGDYAKVLEIAAYQLKTKPADIDDDATVAAVKEKLADTAVLEANSKEYKDMKVGDADTAAKFAALVTSNGQTAYLLDTLKLVFPIEQARVLAELEKIDLTLYTDDIMNPGEAFPVSYAKAAKAKKDELVAAVKKETLDAEDLDASKVIAKLANMQDQISASNITAADSYTGLDGVTIVLTYKLADASFKTKDDLKNDNVSLEAAKLAAKAQAQAYASEFYKDALTAYNTDKDKAAFDAKVAEKDAYLEVELFKIDQATTMPINVTTLTAGTANRDLVAKYNALEQAAAAYKLQVEKDGSLKYIAAKIDENLAAAKAKIYGRTGETVPATALIVGAENKNEDIAWIKAQAVASIETARDAALAAKTYYDKEADEIKARYALVIAQVNACTNGTQVNAVLDTVKDNTGKISVDIRDVKDAAAVKSAIKGLAGYAKELDKVQTYMDQVVNADVNKWSDAYREFTTDDLANFYGEKGARTTAEIQALLADAKAMAAALPSVKEKKDAKAAAEKAVNDIPNRIALTDKEAVAAASKLVETAKGMGQTVSNEARLNAAISAVKALEIKALNDQIAALPALNKIAVADKAAVKAVSDALDALYGTDMYGDLSGDTAVNAIAATVENYQKAVRTAVKADVEAKIAALAANASKSDVEAARAAYDAFVEEYTDASEPYDAKAQIVNADKLFYAEAQLKANEVKAVEGLKLTASSAAKKGSITVKWTVKGEVAAADGYEVFRSVKRNSGFTNKAFYTTDKNTKKSYKNTKSLKKGTRYYYKVRAYKVVDGVKYYSDWSNKAYRVAK